MSFGNALLAVALLWAAIHAIHAIHYFLNPSHAQSLLPVTTSRPPPTTTTTHVTLTPFHLRVHTTACNAAHDRLAQSLKPTSRRRRLSHLYNAGVVLGVLGMFAALFLLAFTTVSLILKLWPAPSASGLAKRSLDVPIPKINPIIPGVTVPLAHLPLILLAVFLAQIVHEAGHAFAAAIDALPILSAGFSFTFILPSAFVTFHSAALTDLPPRARARIIAAGPFHNLVLWCLLVSVSQLGLGGVLWSIGYKDVSDLGRVVVSVDVRSPLHTYLPPGTLITALDDTLLGSTGTTTDTWTSYLASPILPDLGWCAEPSSMCLSGLNYNTMSLRATAVKAKWALQAQP